MMQVSRAWPLDEPPPRASKDTPDVVAPQPQAEVPVQLDAQQVARALAPALAASTLALHTRAQDFGEWPRAMLAITVAIGALSAVCLVCALMWGASNRRTIARLEKLIEALVKAR